MDTKMSLPEEDLSCCVCCEIFQDPVLLSCSHSVCRHCLKQFWESKGSPECPVCRRRSSREEPPRNLVLRNLCESFLESRSQISSAGSGEDDQQDVYYHCSPTHETVPELKDKLRTALETLQKKLKAFEEAKQDYEGTAAHIKTQAQHTERQIQEEFEKLYRFLRDEEAARIAALKKEEERKSRMMRRKIEEMDAGISSLSDTIRNMEKEMGAEDGLFLKNFKSTMTRARFTPADPKETPEALISVGKHLSNLKFRVWEKMQGMVHYTPVTLDPNTAHPALSLSDELTTIEFRCQESSLPDNPERFDSSVCVLGSEDFNYEKHCWDVHVGDSDHWELGVISESESRKGDCSSGSVWKLCYNKSNRKYWICCPGQSEVTFTPKENVQWVRVQLDWNRGKVKFSDLVTCAHLHTITGTFTERVLPYFCNRSVGPLRVLSVKTSVAVEK